MEQQGQDQLTLDELWRAAELAERMVQAAKKGLLRPENDRENELILKALLMFDAQFDHELTEND